MRGLLVILFFLPLLLDAQRADPYAVGNVPANTNDTPPQKQGVIKVRKPSLRPYFKCEYYLTLAHVTEVEVEVDSPNPSFPGEKVRVTRPFFDSAAYSRDYRRAYPVKMTNFSRTLAEGIQFAYSFGDTNSIDTMAVDMWIGKNGKIRWREVDTTYASQMPRALELELYMQVNQMTDWGEGGGCSSPKKFLRKQKRLSESYYCRLYIIASSKPLSAQQKSTGSRWMPMDTPLNSPEGDDLHGDSKELNRDSVPAPDGRRSEKRKQ